MPEPIYERKHLDMVHVACSKALSSHQLRQAIGFNAAFSGPFWLDNADALVLMLHSYIWAEKRKDVTISYPKTWWDHWKKDNPKWAKRLRLSPPVMVHDTVKVYDGYPTLNDPKMGESVRLVEHFSPREDSCD